MSKVFFVVFGIVILSILEFLPKSIFAQQIDEAMVPSAIGFECAQEAMNVIPLLGRGDNFPDWLLRDIDTELKRQASTSQLLKATCTAAPKVSAAVLPNDENDTKQGNVLSQLRIEFYLDLIVNTGNRDIPLKIEQVYLANHLETIEKRTVTQKFVVVQP